MAAAVLLLCAALAGQPAQAAADDAGQPRITGVEPAPMGPSQESEAAPEPPAANQQPIIPGLNLSGPLNILYQPPPPLPQAGVKTSSPGEAQQTAGPLPQQAGVKTPSPETPSAEEVQKAALEAAEQPTPKVAPWYSVHAQATVVSQGNWKFFSPYVGTNSLRPNLNYRTTNTDTLYLDVRPWHGGEIVFNPEVSGGTGLSNTLGLAGFPNGEATRIGAIEPTPYFARLFYRHTFELDGEWENAEDAANQISGPRARNRFQISVGKMSAEDVLDDNVYSHDPRTQFLNWSIMYTGAWDYPANVRGYTYGVLLDYTTMFYAVRYGIFAEPAVANAAPIDPHILKAHGQFLEFQEDFILQDHPLRVREWVYLNTAHMGKYREALAEMPVNPDITQTRSYRNKYGFGLSLEKEITDDLGFFLRAGWNDGQSESWAFTEIDQTAAAGFLLKGKAWHRPTDQIGVAGVINGISDAHRDYLAAGGLGFIIGDGALSYLPEEIAETWYDWQLARGIFVTFDFQGVEHPAYNPARGPVAIAAVGFHLEY